MPEDGQTLFLATPAETDALGRRLAAWLRPGDSVLLSGNLGAGKSHLARAAIRALCGPDTEVPSPTYTLVQSYDGPRGPVLHADLYRLGDPSELDELGLAEALGRDVCLIEWPDRLPGPPAGAIRIELHPEGEGRTATISASAGRLDAMRAAGGAGFADAAREPVAGDASARRFSRLRRADGATAILMQDPGGAAETARFAALADRLSAAGLAPPAILAHEGGAMVVEDLGDGLVSALADADPAEAMPLYLAATETLLRLRAADPAGLPAFDAAEMARQGELCWTEWAGRSGASPWRDALARALVAHAGDTGTLILRDCHAGNLIWDGRMRVIDFQDAMAGPEAYDLVSLLDDARRDVPEDVRDACTALWLERTGADPDAFAARFAVLAAQRALRILGVFARLAKDGKRHYLDHAPRVRGQLAAALSHPALADLRAGVDLPERPA